MPSLDDKGIDFSNLPTGTRFIVSIESTVEEVKYDPYTNHGLVRTDCLYWRVTVRTICPDSVQFDQTRQFAGSIPVLKLIESIEKVSQGNCENLGCLKSKAAEIQERRDRLEDSLIDGGISSMYLDGVRDVTDHTKQHRS